MYLNFSFISYYKPEEIEVYKGTRYMCKFNKGETFIDDLSDKIIKKGKVDVSWNDN